jgi:hypothetical protein
MDQAAPKPDPPTPVSYETQPAAVTVRGFRLLLGLTLLNTMLLGAYVLGPGLGTFLKSQWQSWQQQREAKRQIAANASRRAAAMTTEAGALSYALSPDTLVYDEDRRSAPAATTAATEADSPALLPPPAQFKALPYALKGWGLLHNPNCTVLFMHERRATSAAPPRLVIFFLNSDAPLFNSSGQQLHDPTVRDFLVLTIAPSRADADIKSLAYTSYHWQRGSDASLRLYAGQIDANDPSRFSVRYQLNGESGVIDGRLGADETVDLTPSGPLLKGWQAAQRNRSQ